MTITKWNEKVSAILDKHCMEENIRYANTEDGVYFANKAGYYAYFLPDYHCSSASGNPKNESPMLADIFRSAIDSGVLARDEESGKSGGKLARHFSNGETEAYVYEKFLRVFPKNTQYFISGPTKPVLAGIWGNDRLHVIGLVMPYRKTDFERISH